MSAAPLEKKALKAGENLFKEGQVGDEAYLLRDGYVSIWKMEGNDKVNLGMRGEGEVVGEMALIDDTVRSATVTAQEDLEVEVITKDVLDGLLGEAPELLSTIIHQLMESLRCANDLVAMYAKRDGDVGSAELCACSGDSIDDDQKCNCSCNSNK